MPERVTRERRGRSSNQRYQGYSSVSRRARFTPRGCGFIIPLSLLDNRDPDKGATIPLSVRREGGAPARSPRPVKEERRGRGTRSSGTRGYGPVTTHLPRHNGAAYALRAACSSALCIARPDFRRIPRRPLDHGKGESLHLCDSTESWEIPETLSPVAREPRVASIKC